jgi:hypothetical protein
MGKPVFQDDGHALHRVRGHVMFAMSGHVRATVKHLVNVVIPGSVHERRSATPSFPLPPYRRRLRVGGCAGARRLGAKRSGRAEAMSG